jgi:hypothetical protein
VAVHPENRKGSSSPCAGCCSTPIKRGWLSHVEPKKSCQSKNGQAKKKNGQAKPNPPNPVASRVLNNVASRTRVTRATRSASRSAREDSEEDLAGKKRRENGGGGEPTATGVWRHPGCRPLDGWCWVSLETTRREGVLVGNSCSSGERKPGGLGREGGSGSVMCCLLAEANPHLLGIKKKSRRGW